MGAASLTAIFSGFSSLSPRRKGLLLAATGAVAFSGKAIVAKLMYKLGADAVATVGLRMALAFPMFIAMAWWASRGTATPLSLRQRWQVVGLGFSGYYLASTLDFLGLQYISASLERAILYLNPTLVLLLSAVFLKHKVRPMQLASVGLAYFGVAIVFLHDWGTAQLVSSRQHGMSGAEVIALGSALVFGSALAYAVYLMGSSELVQKLGSLRLVSYASCVACVLCVAQWGVSHFVSSGSVGSLGDLPWQGYALSALNAVACTVLPIWLVMRGVQLLGAPLASQVGMVGPLSTLWMAAWWLDEPITWRLLVGTGAILLGIVLLSRSKQAVTTEPKKLA
jgi:drug/metabolite transporter (DMT)-like permease